jgi:hypothetical protein
MAGGTPAMADATLTFGSYTFLTQNNPVAVNVTEGSTQVQNFIVTASTSALTATVTINATWNATEQYSGRIMTGNAGSNVRNVNIQSRAAITITQIQYTNGTGTYVGGMSFSVQLTFSNIAGGTSATVDAVLTFGGYGFLTQTNPSSVTVAAGGTQVQDFVVTALTSATTSAVTINATWTGTEAISSRALSGNAGSNVRNVNIQSRANVAITEIQDRTGLGIYVGGMTFVIRVNFQNTGGTTANNVNTTLNYASYPYLSSNASGLITVLAGGVAHKDFLITVASNAVTNSSALIRATWTGIEAVSNRGLVGDSGIISLPLGIQARASVTITLIQYTSGRHFCGRGCNNDLRNLHVLVIRQSGICHGGCWCE